MIVFIINWSSCLFSCSSILSSHATQVVGIFHTHPDEFQFFFTFLLSHQGWLAPRYGPFHLFRSRTTTTISLGEPTTSLNGSDGKEDDSKWKGKHGWSSFFSSILGFGFWLASSLATLYSSGFNLPMLRYVACIMILKTLSFFFQMMFVWDFNYSLPISFDVTVGSRSPWRLVVVTTSKSKMSFWYTVEISIGGWDWWV